MADPTQIVEGFSLSHAQILDGSTSFVDAALAAGDDEALDIYGVNNGSLDPSTDQYDNEGDDTVLSSWSWLNYADVTVQAGYLSFPLISTLTNQPVTSSGSGDDVIFGIDLWHEDSFNVAPKPMILRVPSKDHMGTVRTLTFGLYRVAFSPITFDGPTYKDGLKVNYAGRANMSPFDEKGVKFGDGKKRVGRILSHK